MIVTITVLVIVEVLFVQDMVALDSPPYGLHRCPLAAVTPGVRKTASATTRRLPLVGRHRVHRLAGHTLGTPGVTGTLRVRAAREIGRIELAGLDWCNVAGVVKLPLYGAEWYRVVEGERQRRGTLLLRRRY